MKAYDQINEAINFINKNSNLKPDIGIVLGSGLGEFANTVSKKHTLNYSDIPYFKKVSIKGHAGKLVFGKIQNKIIAILQGRYHFYEGYDIKDVVFPIRVLCGMGIEKIILTNAAGGINPKFRPGDLMVIHDHINLMGVNPLKGENDERIGSRFPDMSDVYNKDLIKITLNTGSSLGLKLKTGVYAALTGPSYETPSEIKMLSILGADAVGMSTVPEAIAARHMGVNVAGISCITNLAAGISKSPLNHKEVTETAKRVKNNFIALLEKVILNF